MQQLEARTEPVNGGWQRGEVNGWQGPHGGIPSASDVAISPSSPPLTGCPPMVIIGRISRDCPSFVQLYSRARGCDHATRYSKARTLFERERASVPSCIYPSYPTLKSSNHSRVGQEQRGGGTEIVQEPVQVQVQEQESSCGVVGTPVEYQSCELPPSSRPPSRQWRTRCGT